ncbi:MAG: DNA replication and repair protein RecF [Thermoleophilia bacterium]|nr:DNA replication and repair protein RecF [Thermoleophilia bacterium]
MTGGPPTGAAWRVARLEVTDLRCWRRAELDVPAGLVVICGPNGAGKTSLVEAVVLAALGVSPRTAQLSELVRHDCPALRVAAELEGVVATRREIGYAAGIGRRLVADGAAVRQLAAWRLPGAVLVFVPEELRSVKGPPAARRRALDRLLEAVSPGFAHDAAAYQEALAQRNALLRRARAGETDARAAFPWEARLAEHGARIALTRRRELAGLAAPFARWLEVLGGGPGGRLALEGSPSGVPGDDEASLEEALRAHLERMRPREVAAGMTISGPHRDDVWIGAGDHDLRRLGSQGEQRTAALALLLAHRERLVEAGTQPVLLLDDVLSELDPARRAALLGSVEGSGQVILTAADPGAHATAGARDATVVHVREGTIAA